MAANTSPIYSIKPNVSWKKLTTGNDVYDGSGTLDTNIWAIWQAGSTDGGFLEYIRLKPLGTNAATVIRLFTNNNGVNSTPANNSFFAELALPATTASSTGALPETSIQIARPFNASYRILALLSVTASAGWQATGFGGDYS